MTYSPLVFSSSAEKEKTQHPCLEFLLDKNLIFKDYQPGNYPMFFDIRNDPDERHNLADDSHFSRLMLEYAQKMLSWRMAKDERTLTGLRAGPKCLVDIIRNYPPKIEPII